MDLYYQESHRPTRSMTYLEAIKTGLVKTGDFSGRASRSEFWWNFLDYLPLAPGLVVVNFFYTGALSDVAESAGSGLFSTLIIGPLLYLVVFLQLFLFFSFTTVTIRRLHDVGRSGWWLLLSPTVLGLLIIGFFLFLDGESSKNKYGAVPTNAPIEASMREIISAIPDNFSMSARSAWIGRERVLAVFAGVFLASLVITTVLAYSAGLSGAFLQFSLQEEIFDGKVDFAEDPDPDSEGRTNDSTLWESACSELIEMEEISDCGLVFGRQGVRVNGFFDEGGIIPQPLNAVDATGTIGDWTNVSWDYPEAYDSGPPINDKRTIRFYGDGIWDGDLGERHANRVIYGSWPSSGEEASANRSIILPSEIASKAGVGVNDTIDTLTFTYTYDYLGFASIATGFDDCPGEEYFNQESGYLYCQVNMTVYDLKVVAVYQEGGAGNPTLLFNPIMVSDSVLTEDQKLTLMNNDHGYLGIAIDRNELPASSTRAATDWLDGLKGDIEGVNYTAGNDIMIEYNDLISGTIGFLNIFLGIISVFDYILMIPIVVLSFSVLIYGLVLSLEQRRREISIHRVIGGTESGLTSMILRELAVVGVIGWFTGYLLAMASVPVVLDAVGFMAFERSDFRVVPTLSGLVTLLIFTVTVGLTLLFGSSKTKDFLSIEIDEGVRRVATRKKSRLWLHLIIFFVGILSFLESWIESNGGFGPITDDGLSSNFIVDGLLFLFGPFFLWIGGALVLGRIGASGPRIFTTLFGWSPVLTDIKRGLKGSGSSESVNRLAIILLLTLSIVTVAAVQGYTGTLVDERTTSAQTGADLQVQFEEPVSQQRAMEEVTLAIQRAGESEIDSIDYVTSVGDIFTNQKGEGSLLRTWILFDGHENTLQWDEQTIPEDDIDLVSAQWSSFGFTAGSSARNQLDISRNDIGSNTTIEYTSYSFGGLDSDMNPIITTTVTGAEITYMGGHRWVPGLQSSEANQAIVIGEATYKELLGQNAVDSYTSNRWFFELCDETQKDCKDALKTLGVEVSNGVGVASSSNWGTNHEANERTGGLIFGTPGLLSLQFVVASLASIASAFVFLSLVLSQRKKELAILQAIGASPQQVMRLVLFEIMAILLVSMGLGVILGLAISEAFNGFFGVFGFIFQIFLGQSAPIDRDLVWPWTELIFVNASVLVAVVIALLFTTRRALKSDLAIVLKGE